jgi:hypothetical protein
VLRHPVIQGVLAAQDELEKLGHLHVHGRGDGDERRGGLLVILILGVAGKKTRPEVNILSENREREGRYYIIFLKISCNTPTSLAWKVSSAIVLDKIERATQGIKKRPP